MEKSLYFQYTQKFFPQLVTSITERLNEKRQNALSYMYRDYLTPVYSADGRWASVLAEYTRVAADVVALDSELPLKSRDTLEVAQGLIPKIGMKLYMTEKQMKDADNMIAQGLPIGQIVQNIFADVPRVIEGVYERIEDIFLSELSTGVGLTPHNNGTGARIDVGYYDDHKFGCSIAAWASDTTAPAIDDIQKVFDKALDDQNTITDIFVDDTWLNAFYKNQQVRQQYAFIQNFVGSNIPNLSFDQARALVLSKWGVVLHRVARKVKTEINGVKQNHAPWQSGMSVFTCNAILGNLVWTTCAEVTRPVANVTYQAADDFILASRYSTNDPLREFTSSQAMVVPIIDNVDQIYTLDSTTIIA